LVLKFDTMPEDAWFDAMDRDLTTPGLDVVAIAGRGNFTTIRGIASSRTLFKKHSTAVPLNMVDTSKMTPDLENDRSTDAVAYTF
jgi:hypothetical protein